MLSADASRAEMLQTVIHSTTFLILLAWPVVNGIIRLVRRQSSWGLFWSQISCVEDRRSIRMRELGVQIGNSG
jgi:hypothetical protein